MNENEQVTREITIADMFGIIKKRFKIIIAVALIGAILFSAFGLAASFFLRAYSASAEFSLDYEDDTEIVQSNDYIISLLHSESFAEMLLLDENGLPSDKKDTKEYNEVIVLEKEKAELKDRKATNEKLLTVYSLRVTNADRALAFARSEYTAANNLLGDMYTGSASDDALEQQKAIVDKAWEDLKKCEQEYDALQKDKSNLTETIKDDVDLINSKQREIDTKRGALLSAFRADEETRKKIRKVKNGVVCEFRGDSQIGRQTLLVVNVCLTEDETFVSQIFNQVITRLPEYIEDRLISYEGETSPTCTLIYKENVDQENYKNPLLNAGIYGLIGFAVGVVVSAGVFVLIDSRLNKKSKKENLEEEISEAE